MQSHEHNKGCKGLIKWMDKKINVIKKNQKGCGFLSKNKHHDEKKTGKWSKQLDKILYKNKKLDEN